MEALIEKKKGNPNFGKKSVQVVDDLDKIFDFELIRTYEIYKPEVVIITGRNSEKSVGKSDTLYPPTFAIPNSGLAWDEENNRQRAWRFINTEESIWIDEQRDLTKEEEASLLSNTDNQLEFKKGKLMVRGIEKSKLAALMVQDMYEGKKKQLKQIPPVYRLLNPEAILKNTQDTLDLAWEAESAARSCSVKEMFEFASVLGISLEQSEAGTRKDFILAAKSNPAYFVKHFVNPKNKYQYAFSEAVKNGLISVNKDSAKLVWSESKAEITSIAPNADVAQQLAERAVNKESDILALFEQLSNL
jgi:hypothetical protein